MADGEIRGVYSLLRAFAFFSCLACPMAAGSCAGGIDRAGIVKEALAFSSASRALSCELLSWSQGGPYGVAARDCRRKCSRRVRRLDLARFQERGEFGFGGAKDFEEVGSFARGQVCVGLTLVLARENLTQSLPEITAHFVRERVECR